MKEQLEVDAELIVGHSGIFEVAVDGKVVATKTRAGFPTPNLLGLKMTPTQSAFFMHWQASF